MLHTRCPDQDRVTVLALEETVVRDPAEGDLGESQIVLLRDLFDLGERLEVGLVPVPRAVVLSEISSESVSAREAKRRRRRDLATR